MAKLYVTGPAHLFVGPTIYSQGQLGLTGPLQYLGTAEYAPNIQIRAGYLPVHNDLGGSVVPFDSSFQGEEGFTFVDINRYNEIVLARIQARPRNHFANQQPPRGLNYPGDIGSLMIQEGLAYSVVVVFPYAAKPAMAGMPFGYRFPFSWLLGPDDLKELGTKPRKVGLVFYHGRGFNPLNGQFLVYDNTLPQLPAID